MILRPLSSDTDTHLFLENMTTLIYIYIYICIYIYIEINRYRDMWRYREMTIYIDIESEIGGSGCREMYIDIHTHR